MARLLGAKLKALTASLAHAKAEPQANLAFAWGPKRDGTWGEELRSAPSCLQIEARSIDRPLNLNFELNEKPGPDRKLRATLLWRRQEAAP